VSHSSPSTHQHDIRLRAKHFAIKAVQSLQSLFVKLLKLARTGGISQSATTYLQWGDNRPEPAAAWDMVRPSGPRPGVHDLHTWPLEHFLWGFVTDEVYVPTMPLTLNNMKDGIRTPTTKTERPLLKSVWKHRLHVCWATNGAHWACTGYWGREDFEFLFTTVSMSPNL
jgi:hypothetical protein